MLKHYPPERANAESGAQDYAAPTQNDPAPIPFAHALELIAPWVNSPRPGMMRYPGRNALIAAALQGRASFEAIKGWRYGRRSAPQWARDMLASHLERDAAERIAVARQLRETIERRARFGGT